MAASELASTHATPVERGLIYDLRDLFRVFTSAKHVLEDKPNGAKRATLPAATEFYVGDRLLMMAPMIRAIGGPGAQVRFDLARVRTPVKLVPALFEAAILELVSHASAALRLLGRIFVRVRREGRSVRITIADDGNGMDKLLARRALVDDLHIAEKGTGFFRARHLARTSHGTVRLPGCAGRGTVVALILPMVLALTLDEPAVQHGRRTSPRMKGHAS
ncbi:ATP-binding protein [Rhizorhabdus dicambivorans]|uniref:ATP-binding protein n=1 Tax=Rhizorhabdus dicambivorans TaxID=1850238 RepID=A0A2A4FUW1_9SPHN|nr:ATP-binding protein [Rhizorhabdus dicambivorans]ATE63881.1 ATP-binding protein [Rhizorhabdus dicambivorans]PCE41484.1 ATP-binding protein [Rhizorhabdus dicambivorans]